MSTLNRYVRRLLGRADQRLPAPIADRVWLIVRAFGDRPLVAPPTGDCLVVVAPHPDDETIMCGGTIAAHCARGGTVMLIVVTDGESGGDPSFGASDVAAARRAEQERAAAVLGVAGITRLGLRDGALSAQMQHLTSVLSATLRDGTADVVITPWWLEGHSDHAAVARAVAAAVPDDVEVWAGEVWTPLVPNRLVDMTVHMDTKRAAIACYETASRAVDLDSLAALSRYRSAFGLRGNGYAEAFIALSADGYRAAVAGPGR